MGNAMIEDEDSTTTGPLSVGVPLVRLVKRRLKHVPELVQLTQPRAIVTERFRRLKTLLVNHEVQPQVIVVTSALPSEGKSLIAMNLALSFAADRDKGDVLIVDADLRRPSVEEWIEPAPKLGMSEILTDQTTLEHCVIQLENSKLKVLAAGAPLREPLELFTSPLAQSLMAELRRQYRVIIIDTPPIVPFADADALGRLADGALLVSRSDVTTQSLYRQAVGSIQSMPILGSILNDTTPNLADRDRQYSKYYYAYYRQESQK